MSRRYFVHHAGSYVELEDGAPLRIGRDMLSELRLDDASVSRRHCRLERAGDRCFVVDEDSRNGVLVNGEKVQGSTRVHHGDVLIVGARHVSFHARVRPPAKRSSLPHPRLDEVPAEVPTRQASDPLSIFADGAREALRDGDLFVAEMGAKNLLSSLKTLAARGCPPPPELGRVGVDLALELAEHTGASFWLDEADAVTNALRLELPSEVLQRGRQLRLRTA